MKKLLVFVAILSIFSGCTLRPRANQGEIFHGKDFEAIELSSGRRVHLKNQLAPVTMLHFWATWCTQCIAELPTIERLQRNVASSNFKILAVAIESTPDGVKDLKQRLNLTFPLWIDIAGEVKDLYHIPNVPFTVFLDQSGSRLDFKDPEDGDEVRSIQAPREWNSMAAADSVKTLLKELEE